MMKERDKETGRAEQLESLILAFNQDLETLVHEHVEKGRQVGEEELRALMVQPSPDAPELVRALYENVHTVVEHLLDANRKLSQMATRDPLTGVYNRAFFNEALRLEVAEAMRSGGHIMFVMVDIDRFKEVNDTEGHVNGDRLLKDIAHLLRTSVRASDLVIRYGGDEFLVVAPRLDAAACDLIVDRLKRAEHRVERGHVTLSIGCSVWSPGDDIESAIRRADEEMYENKRSKHTSKEGRKGSCS